MDNQQSPSAMIFPELVPGLPPAQPQKTGLGLVGHEVRAGDEKDDCTTLDEGGRDLGQGLLLLRLVVEEIMEPGGA